LLLIEDAPGYSAYALVRLATAVPAADAYRAVSATLTARVGMLGGTAIAGTERHFGWSIAPQPASPLGFELVPMTAGVAESGVDALVNGPIDVPAAGAALVRRELLAAALPADAVAAFAELAQRARAASLDVRCLPSFAWRVPADADDRGRAAALRAFAARAEDLQPTFRRPAGVRARYIDRDTRLEAGRRVRVPRARPPLALLVAPTGAAVRAAMRVRGDRYLLIAQADAVPHGDALDALIERIEDDASVALAAPDVAALDGRCVLVHVGRFPQHVEALGATAGEACRSLLDAAHALRRGVRVPGLPAAEPRSAEPPEALTAVMLAGSIPEITRSTIETMLGQLRSGDRVMAALAASAVTARRALAAFVQVELIEDDADPFLTGAANRALGSATTPLVAVIADDVLLARGALPALRAAFAALPTLGAAFPRVSGASGDDASREDYGDIAAFEKLAERQSAARAREREPIDNPSTPVFVVRRAALEAVGGFDPAYGPTQRGIADLALRLRAAGYGVVRCEDAYAHRFAPQQSRNAAAHAEVAAPFDVRAAVQTGFDPARRIAFTAPAARAAASDDLVVLVPAANEAELERAALFTAEVARKTAAGAALRVHVLLDGDVGAAAAAARLRRVLIERGTPLADSLRVTIERTVDLATWRAAQAADTRFAAARGSDRAAFADLPQLHAGAAIAAAREAVR
jgi:GT2 family glycosyltransferase